MEKKTLKLAELDLDLQNPRTGPSRDQIEALQQLLLVEKFGDKVFALAADICEVGMLDPGERLYVMQSESEAARFTALDGNRRVAALRLLAYPTLVDNPALNLTPQMRVRFKKLQTQYSGKWPEELDVVVFDDRAQSEHFIGVRHKGERGGAGRSEWSALQIARFDNSGLWQCVQSLRTGGELPQSVLSALDTGEFAITTFDRVAGGRAFGARFGSAIGASEFRIGASPARATKALAQLAADVVSGKVTSRDDFAKAETTGAYIDALALLVDIALAPKSSSEDDRPGQADPTDPDGKPDDQGRHSGDQKEDGRNMGERQGGTEREGKGSEDEKAGKPENNSGKGKPPGTTPPRKKRESKYLLERNELLYVHANAKCLAIVLELKSKVELKQAPYACALLIRALQELTADIYMHTVAGHTGTQNKTTVIATAAKHLLANQPKDAPADLVKIVTAFLNSAETYAELSDVAHNKLVNVSDAHVRATWESLRGGMGLLWQQIYLKTVT